MTRFVHAPRQVRACDLGPATVLVNYRTGAVQMLPGTSGRWWSQVAATGDTSTANAMSGDAAIRLAAMLRTSGMLEDADRPLPWEPPVKGRPWRASWGAQELPFGFESFPRVPVSYLLAAAGGLTTALLTRSMGRRRYSMRRMVGLVALANRVTFHPASAEQAERAVYAVRRIGIFAPNRAACLEESVAAVVVLAVFGRSVHWCHGVVADPIRLHAWIETDDGSIVAEPPSTRRCTAILTISQP